MRSLATAVASGQQPRVQTEGRDCATHSRRSDRWTKHKNTLKARFIHVLGGLAAVKSERSDHLRRHFDNPRSTPAPEKKIIPSAQGVDLLPAFGCGIGDLRSTRSSLPTPSAGHFCSRINTTTHGSRSIKSVHVMSLRRIASLLELPSRRSALLTGPSTRSAS